MRVKLLGVRTWIPRGLMTLLMLGACGPTASSLAVQDPVSVAVDVNARSGLKPALLEKANEVASEARGWNFHVVQPGQVEVRWETQPITGYRIHELKKPVLYPVLGPGGHSLTRNYPLVVGTAGEATDHPHHKSIWLAHGNVNGHSYWDEKAIIRAVGEPQLLPDEAAMIVQHEWLATDSTDVVAREETRLSFGCLQVGTSPLEAGWWLQYQVRVTAVAETVTFGDTKEGFFAMRTHPNLQLTNDPGAGVTTANGRALNSEGLTDKALWGQKAQWVAYGGKISEQSITIVMMDHPTNLRHPTTWHARDYGLVAANPFGLHDFQKLPAGTGDFALSQGECLEFCYRIAFLPTLLDEKAIRAAYRDFEAVSPKWQK
ncbi:MAG: PmoA family protein [Planctomycetaceae bacterium]|nr:PmoA family protein [Planctomycetaceae bacterium]